MPGRGEGSHFPPPLRPGGSKRGRLGGGGQLPRWATWCREGAGEDRAGASPGRTRPGWRQRYFRPLLAGISSVCLSFCFRRSRALCLHSDVSPQLSTHPRPALGPLRPPRRRGQCGGRPCPDPASSRRAPVCLASSRSLAHLSPGPHAPGFQAFAPALPTGSQCRSIRSPHGRVTGRCFTRHVSRALCDMGGGAELWPPAWTPILALFSLTGDWGQAL